MGGFIMWIRRELKQRAKELLKLNYWKIVLVSLILMMISGGTGGSSGSIGNTTNSQIHENEYDYVYDDYNDDYDDDFDYDHHDRDFSDFFFGRLPGGFSLSYGLIAIIIAVFLIVLAISLATRILAFNPLIVGCQRFFTRCDKQEGTLNDVVFSFSSSYGNVIKTMLLTDLYIFLWSLLLIIPGIIKSYEYRMIPYILGEHPELSTKEAFALSKQMMDGEKWNAFVLDLSFLGWTYLGILTCCILNIFYVNPYIHLTDAQLYLVLKQKVEMNTNAGNTEYTENTINENPYL